MKPYNGRPAYLNGRLILLEKEGVHLDFDDVDIEIGAYLEGLAPNLRSEGAASPECPLELVVFLSKHRSEKEVDSLTVHPPGNYSEALHGGRDSTLPSSSPRYMTSALKALYEEKKASGLKDRTSFEVTHHGPAIGAPGFFIEIGSNATRWNDPSLAAPIASALLSRRFQEPPGDLPVAVGVGGGHYAPRFTDMALKGDFAFGHMVPDHVIMAADDPFEKVEMALSSTPQVSTVLLHRTKGNEALLGDVVNAAEGKGLRIIEI